MGLKWSEKKKAWLNPLTGQWVKGPAPAKEEPVIEKTVAPQTLHEAPVVEREVTEAEIDWHGLSVPAEVEEDSEEEE